MIIFLYGADSFRSKQKLDEIIGHYKSSGKSGLNLILFDASAADFGDFYNQFKVSPMFAEKKLIIVRHAFDNKAFQEDFAGHLKTLEQLPDVIVIYEGREIDQRLKLFKALTKECKVQEFKLMEARQVKAWVRAEFERQKARANLDAIDLLAAYVGNDGWRMANEIKKLIEYKNGNTIRADDVKNMVKSNIDADIFKTIDALAVKDKKQALELIYRHLDAGDEPLHLLSMLAYQFRTMLVIKELAEKGLMYNSIVQKSGFHPFVVKKNYFACRHFSLAELKKIYHAIFEVDSAIKTGKIEPETALVTLVAEI